MDPDVVKAFDFAADLSKQLITLSTMFITLTLTFLTGVIRPRSSVSLNWLYVSWISFVLSIVAGLLTLMTLTGHLDPSPDLKPGVCLRSIYCDNVRTVAILQIALFMFGIVFAILFGALLLQRSASSQSQTTHCEEDTGGIKQPSTTKGQDNG